jgi:hypothetical protein
LHGLIRGRFSQRCQSTPHSGIILAYAVSTRNLEEHFVRPRLILDHPGNKRRRLVTRFFAEETRLWGKVIAKTPITIAQGEPPVRSRTVADDPGTPRHGNLTALISLGIPKLVRFHKIHPRRPDTVHMVILYLIRPPSACSLPARRVERTDGALAPRQRDACLGNSNSSSSQPSRASWSDQQRFRAK